MSSLRSNVLILRPIEAGDLSYLMQVENDSSEWIQSENYLPFSKTVMEKYVNGDHDLLKYGQYRFVLEVPNTSEVIGCIDLFNYSPIHSRAGVGIYVSTEYRGRGYAKEALNLLSEYCRGVLNIELLYCSILETNLTSLAAFESVGFKQTGKRISWSKIGKDRINVNLLQQEL